MSLKISEETAKAVIAEADEEGWLTIQELATLKRVHHQTVREWIRRGFVPAERMGPRGNWRVKFSCKNTS